MGFWCKINAPLQEQEGWFWVWVFLLLIEGIACKSCVIVEIHVGVSFRVSVEEEVVVILVRNFYESVQIAGVDAIDREGRHCLGNGAICRVSGGIEGDGIVVFHVEGVDLHFAIET